MPTNDFVPVATAVGANVLSQSDYLASPYLDPGQQPGIASSQFNNKALRQATYFISVLAQFLANTTGDNVLDDTNSANLLATMALAWPGAIAPTQTVLSVTGTTAGWLFTVSSANATVGATYSNNTNIYTVLATIAGATQLFCSQASAPTSSGTLTKQSGTGDSTIIFSAAQALAVYTPPANVTYLKLKMVGAGGGGCGSTANGQGQVGGAAGGYVEDLISAPATSYYYSVGIGGAGGTAGSGAGGTGTVTSFGILDVCNGGNGGSISGSVFGGIASRALGSGVAINGTSAGGGGADNAFATNGAAGASSPFGGGGYGGESNGGNAATNSGSGGGGGGAVTSNHTGGNGANGLIIIEEHYSG